VRARFQADLVDSGRDAGQARGVGRVRTIGTIGTDRAADDQKGGQEKGETTHYGPRRKRVDNGMGPSLY
jgi:hypothetical protein